MKKIVFVRKYETSQNYFQLKNVKRFTRSACSKLFIKLLKFSVKNLQSFSRIKVFAEYSKSHNILIF